MLAKIGKLNGVMDVIKSVKNVIKDINLMPSIIVLKYQLHNHNHNHNQSHSQKLMTNNLFLKIVNLIPKIIIRIKEIIKNGKN